MGNEFAINIAVNPGSSAGTIASVKKPLAELEDAGPRVGKSISEGLQRGSAAADTLARSFKSVADAIRADQLSSAGKAFAGLAEQIRREQEMLERIEGPTKEYMADLQALDGLLQRNAISTQTYAEQVTKLNQRLGERPHGGGAGGEAGEGGFRLEGNVVQALGAQAGGLGSALGGLVSTGALEAGALAEVGVKAVELNDDFDKLHNATLRLTGSSATVSLAMSQQLAIAGDLHTSLEGTIEVATEIKEHTDELNMSVAEQNRLTKELGEIAIESGHSVGDAGQIIQRLGYDFQEGLPAGRDLRSLMREFQPLAEALKTHFHASGKEIVEMGNTGRISMQDFVKAVDDGSEEIDKKFGERIERVGERWQHVKDQVTTGWADWVGHAVGVKTATDDINHALAMQAEQQLQEIELQEKLNKATIEAAEDVERYAMSHSELADRVTDAVKAMAEATKLVEDRDAKITAAAEKERSYAAAVGLVRDKIAQFKAAGAKDPMALLTPGDVAIVRGYQDAQEEAIDATQRYGGVLGDIHKRETDRQRGIEDLNGALKAGLITQKEYNEELAKYVHQHLSEEEKLLREIHAPMQKIMDGERDLAKLYGDNRISLGTYQLELEKFREELEKVDQAETKLALHTLDKTFGGLGSALGSDLGHLATIRGYGADLVSSAQSIAEEHDKNSAAETTRDAEQALKDYNKEAERTKTLLEAGLRPFGEQLIKLAETGKFSFSEMADSIISDLLRMEEKWLEMKAIGFLQNAINGPSPDSDAGFLQTATEIAAHVDGGATGMERDIVRAANGYSGTFGGRGGTDSQLFMAMVTPGEHVSITTPAQQQALQRGMQSAPTNLSVGLLLDRDAVLRHMASPEGKRIIIDLLRQYGR